MSVLSKLVIPSWFVAAIAAIWASLLLWQFVGRGLLAQSKDQQRLDQVTARGEEVEIKKEEGLAHELKQAGLELSPASFNLLRGAAVALGVIIGPVLGLPPLAGIILGIGFWFGARWWVGNKAKQRGRKIDKELPAALSRMSALLPLVTSLPKLLMMIADSLKTINPNSPLASELQTTAVEVRDRGAIEGLENLEARAPSPALKTLAFNLRIYVEAGGEHAGMMANAAKRLQRLIDGRNKARAKASGALTFAKILPVILVIVTIITFQDPTVQRFYRSAIGQIVVVAIAGTMFVGYQVMKSMVENVA